MQKLKSVIKYNDINGNQLIDKSRRRAMLSRPVLYFLNIHFNQKC